MEKAIVYKTDDLQERDVTMALHDIVLSIASFGFAKDPMDIVCECAVRQMRHVRFASYSYDGEEVCKIAACKPDVWLHLPSPNVERKILADLRKLTSESRVAEITPEHSLTMLPADERNLWNCHRGLATRISVGGKSTVVFVLYFHPEFKISDRHREWMLLIGDYVSAILTMRKDFCNLHVKCDSGCLDETCNRWKSDLNFDKWIDAGVADSRIKALVGLRGTMKSVALGYIRKRILAKKADASHVIHIDCEDARSRRFKKAADISKYLKTFSKSNQPYYLFLDEVGMIDWHTQLLETLSRLEGWNVWVAASSAHAVTFGSERKDMGKLSVYRMWSDPNRPRSRSQLEKIWCQVFMRDAIGGEGHSDIRAKEKLAEYFSDHLGEVKSLREIANELKTVWRSISRSSVSTYRQSLVDAYLIEISEIYDVFEGRVVTSVGGRAFYTDLELRNWRFGSASEGDARRVALNRFYLELRRQHDKVYTPRDGEADFVTLKKNGEPKLWRLQPQSGGGGGIIADE